MFDMFGSNVVPIFTCVFFFFKFLVFALWYRCTEAGNIVERTDNVFWWRAIMDVIPFVFVIYVMVLEH